MSDIDFPKARDYASSAIRQTPGVKQKQQKTGAPTPRSAPNKKASNPLFSTFPQLALPSIDQKQLVDILKKLEVDLFENQLSSETAVIETDQDQIKELTKNNQKRLADMLKKIEKKKHTSLVGQIFGWIGAVLGVVLGAVLAVVSFGTGSAVAGTLIALSVALAVTMVVLSATGGMDKMVAGLAKPLAKMFESFGMDAKKAREVAQITSQVLITVAVIAIQITLAVASGGASAANFTSELANKIASISMKVVNFSLAANQMAAAGLNTASGVYNYQAKEALAGSESDKAILRKIEALIEDEDDTIKELLGHLLSSQKNMGQLIKNENENRATLADIDASSATV